MSTQVNMFRYLFYFPKTFYTFSVKTMQAHIFRYLFNLSLTFPQIYFAAFLTVLKLFHEFLVLSAQANMFRYLFGFLKTFYIFLVSSIQTETFRYLVNFIYYYSDKYFGHILVITIKVLIYWSNSFINNEINE